MATSKPTTEAPPAGAKRRMRGPERRAQLLAVARRVFGRSGFHGVSMDEVAKEAGVTKPILYDHFNSKEELYVALLDADADFLEERVRSALRAPTGNRERIRQSFQEYFDFVPTRCRWRWWGWSRRWPSATPGVPRRTAAGPWTRWSGWCGVASPT